MVLMTKENLCSVLDTEKNDKTPALSHSPTPKDILNLKTPNSLSKNSHDIHAYIHTYMYTYGHVFIHSFIHTYLHTYIYTYGLGLAEQAGLVGLRWLAGMAALAGLVRLAELA